MSAVCVYLVHILHSDLKVTSSVSKYMYILVHTLYTYWHQSEHSQSPKLSVRIDKFMYMHMLKSARIYLAS